LIKCRVVGPSGEARAVPAKFALDKTAPLQATLQTLLWLGALAIAAISAALLVATVFGAH
jgi:hypothetical protein